MLLFARQEIEELVDRLQQYFRISLLEVRSRKEIGADHLQAVTAGLVRSQHQGSFQGLLDDRNLAFVDLEINDLVRF